MHPKLIEDFGLHPKQFFETVCMLHIQFVAIDFNRSLFFQVPDHQIYVKHKLKRMISK